MESFCQQLCVQHDLAEAALTTERFPEIEFLYQSISVVRCFKLTVSALRSCDSQISSRQAADLIAYAESCRIQITGTLNELPTLRKEVENSRTSSEAFAALGFALNHLDDDYGALSAFREALRACNKTCFTGASRR
jgi:hypothetical protein